MKLLCFKKVLNNETSSIYKTMKAYSIRILYVYRISLYINTSTKLNKTKTLLYRLFRQQIRQEVLQYEIRY